MTPTDVSNLPQRAREIVIKSRVEAGLSRVYRSEVLSRIRPGSLGGTNPPGARAVTDAAAINAGGT